MDFRHEVKHEISYSDRLVLRQRLSAVMKPDPYSINGRYVIRSLYFDNIYDKALREKLDGVAEREKYRIRLYNGNLSMIRLERKYKLDSLGTKDSAVLTLEQTKRILEGDTAWLASEEDPVLLRFWAALTRDGLRPQCIVDYTREPFIFGPGDVRVTLDYDIRTGMRHKDFLDMGCMTVPAPYSPGILEVKWNEFLPNIIRRAVSLPGRQAGAFSKYAACRMYD